MSSRGQIFSRYFGTFYLQEREVVHFPGGLPGFEDQTEYAALSVPGQEPILYLQSVTRPELCLITLPARVFCADYQLELNAEERETLALPSGLDPTIGTDIACQVIVTVDRNREPAANLAAPLVINLSNHLGIQVFQAGADYSFRQPIAELLQLAEC
jgi:flagellar assembly factor FliW